jgi:hypothetical protein
MLLIAVLLVALVCLALGLILASAPWLIGSLIASLLAFAMLMLMRRSGGSSAPAARVASDSAVAAAPATPVVAGATGPGADSVWVVDGRPEYHRADCALIADLDAEPVPHLQATEDGFTPCAICTPDAEPVAAEPAPKDVPAADATPEAEPSEAEPPEAEPPATAPAGDVWVVSGRSRYHAAGCLIIEGKDAKAVPADQAREDGLMACSLCEPDVVHQD